MLTQEQIEQISADPKKFLNRAYRAAEKIEAKRERIQSWRQISESITAPLKAAPSGGSGPSNKVEMCVISIAELEDEIEDQIQELISIQREIGEAIRLFVVDENLQALLELRYLNCLPWEAIATRLNYTFRWTLTLHGRALSMLQENCENKKAC